MYYDISHAILIMITTGGICGALMFVSIFIIKKLYDDNYVDNDDFFDPLVLRMTEGEQITIGLMITLFIICFIIIVSVYHCQIDNILKIFLQ